MKRDEILEAARVCVCGEREQDYGTPEDSFGLIGQLWTAYMGTLFTQRCGHVMALLKVAATRLGTKRTALWTWLAMRPVPVRLPPRRLRHHENGPGGLISK